MIFKKIVYKKFFFFLLSIISISKTFSNSENTIFLEQPRWNDNFNFEETENRLRNEKIVSIISLKQYKQLKNKSKTPNKTTQKLQKLNVYIAFLESGLKAILKTRHTIFAEVSAYEASKYLNTKIVPPTVIRKVKNKLCSLQFFIEPCLPENNFEKNFDQLDNVTKSNFLTFLFIFWAFDTHSGNKLFQTNDNKLNIALIDNERLYKLIKTKYGKKRTFMMFGDSKLSSNSYNSTKFPFDQSKTIRKNDNINLRVFFKNYFLKNYEFNRLQNILKKTGKIEYIVWEDALWIKDKYCIPIYVNHYTEQIIKKLKKLDLSKLETIWRDALKHSNYSQKHRYYRIMKDIIDRKNQILKHFEKNGILIK